MFGDPFQFAPALGCPDPDYRDITLVADLDGRPEYGLGRGLADTIG